MTCNMQWCAMIPAMQPAAMLSGAQPCSSFRQQPECFNQPQIPFNQPKTLQTSSSTLRVEGILTGFKGTRVRLRGAGVHQRRLFTGSFLPKSTFSASIHLVGWLEDRPDTSECALELVRGKATGSAWGQDVSE
jgi:hypothetical protein